MRPTGVRWIQLRKTSRRIWLGLDEVGRGRWDLALIRIIEVPCVRLLRGVRAQCSRHRVVWVSVSALRLHLD